MPEAMQFVYPSWPAPANVRAVSTTRRGGASAGAYQSFNLAEHVGDDPACVAHNRRLLGEVLMPPSAPVWLKQVHGTHVVEAADAAAGAVADGAHTDRPRIVCAVLTADCLPIFICDRSGTHVALLHAGWRGLSAGIVEAGMPTLRADADQLLVWLGPAIGPAAYEVGDEVRQAFVAHDPQAAEAFLPRTPGKWSMDIYQLARQRLTACGVQSIYGGAHCTATQADLFYSHRRDGVTGRMASLIWLE